MRKIIILLSMFAIMIPSENYKEPKYQLIKKDRNIEIREYGEYIVAKTTVNKNFDVSENNMFRTLASYIFGNNHQNKKIPMTAPVTTVTKSNSFDMIFYMLDAKNVEELPDTDINNIIFDSFKLGKCAVIKFSWFTNEKKIAKYKRKLERYLIDENLEPYSNYMVNRYDPPWRIPFLRRNEVLVRIR